MDSNSLIWKRLLFSPGRPLAAWKFTVLICFSYLPTIHGAYPGVHLSQLEHSTWRLSDGFFVGAPRGLAQTKDGYLWIGTMRGLVRFDGVRFVPWKPPEKQQLGSLVIRSLLAARDGSLWIGTSTGLAHWTGGELINFPGPVAFIQSIFESRDGTIWVTRARIRDRSGPICRVEGRTLHCYGKSDGISATAANPIIQDTQGNLWFGAAGALVERKGNKFQNYQLRGVAAGNVLYTIEGLANDPDDSVWAGISAIGLNFGLEQFKNDRWKSFSTPNLDGSAQEIETLFRDRDGWLWVGTERSGIYRIGPSQVDHFDRADGLSSNNVTGFQQDSEGDLWVTTMAGLDVFRKRPVVTYSSREGLSADGVHAVVKRNNGSIWMSNVAALDAFLDGQVKSISVHDGLPGRAPSSLMEDRQGRLWAGMQSGLYVYDKGQFRTIVPTVVGGPIGIAQDLHDDVWAVLTGKPPRLLRIRDFKIKEEFYPPAVPAGFGAVSDQQGGIWVNLLQGGLMHLYSGMKDLITLSEFNIGQQSPVSAFNLHVETDGTLWGASNRGLLIYRHGTPHLLTERNGLPCTAVYSVISDRHRAIWLYAQCGLIKIDREEVERWWTNPDSNVQMKLFGSTDGVQPGIPLNRPAAARSDDGRLWFANGGGVQVVDPDHLEINHVRPIVHIEQLLADEQVFPLSGRRILPALTREIQIQYTALSFVRPGGVRFRYKLHGYEKQWQEPGSRRAAFYSHLSPGHYEFQVIACNNDGLWNDTGAFLEFSVAAAFYQTYWFVATSSLAVIFLLWQAYLVRLRYVAEQLRIRSDARAAERERIARDLHDTLLQGFLGIMLRLQAVMKDLPENGNSRNHMEIVLDRADEVILEAREKVSVLRSIAQLEGNLPEALRTVGLQLLDGSPIRFRFDLFGKPVPLRPDVFDELFQVGREALSNAYRHSGASEIAVELTYSRRSLTVKIVDDGVGIAEGVRSTGKEGHWGLPGMRERCRRINAAISISGAKGSGTLVEVRIPARFAYRKGLRSPLLRILRGYAIQLTSMTRRLLKRTKKTGNKGRY